MRNQSSGALRAPLSHCSARCQQYSLRAVFRHSEALELASQTAFAPSAPLIKLTLPEGVLVLKLMFTDLPPAQVELSSARQFDLGRV